MRKVNELHPDAEGKPFVIGNCQGGWALMMLAALAPQTRRPTPPRRVADILLGGCRRQEPDALLGRAAGRDLDGFARE